MILMDLNMPVLDGFAAGQNISEFLGKTNAPHIPIFAMTACGNNDKQATVSKCCKAGMSGILYKPVSKEGLMKQVESCI
jgi:CheY-like chemotaxis protein